MAGFESGEVGTGPGYEAERSAVLARLASTAGDRRVDLGGDLVLVFETRETVRTALQELLRAERVASPGPIAAETEAFAELLGGDHDLVATLLLEVSDPVALADRIAELPGIAGAVLLEVAGGRVRARTDLGDEASGAFQLRFTLDNEQRAALLDAAAATITVDHPRLRASATLSPGQVRAIAADLRR
jgi:hypothetical protein